MKYKIIYILSLILLLGSCKSTKNDKSTRMLSAKKVIKAHYKASFDHNTVQAKIKARYSSANTSQSINIKLRIKKDEVIWMSGTFLGIPVAKVKITPTSVQYYEKIKHTYFDGDFSLINKTFGMDLDFYQLQNILLGEAVFNLKNEKYNSQLEEQVHLLTPKKQLQLFDVFYWVNPLHYKLNKQRIENVTKEQYLTISYPEYQEITHSYYPKQLNVKAVQKNKTTQINMEFRAVSFDKDLKFPFAIPEGYKEISL